MVSASLGGSKISIAVLQFQCLSETTSQSQSLGFGPSGPSQDFVHSTNITIAWVWPHHCWLEGKIHFSQSADDALPEYWNPEALDLCCHNGTLLSYDKILVHWHSHILQSCFTVNWKSNFQLAHRFLLSQVKDPAFPFAELHGVLVSSFL